jgi:hypothetical protein
MQEKPATIPALGCQSQREFLNFQGYQWHQEVTVNYCLELKAQ